MKAETGSFVDNDILLLLEQKSPEPPKSAAKPLPFERLVAGIAPKSQTWLFRLPFDILDEIFNYIPHRSLPSFALASRDCCRLARGRQFTNVIFDYSPSSWSLAHRLLLEANLGRDGATQRGRLPSIGPAVRQVSICTAKEYIQQYHKISIWEPRSISKEKLDEAMERYMRYIRTVQLLLASAVPNIEIIIWADRVSLDKDIYLALCQPSVQKLILNEVAADSRFSLDDCSTTWPLRTLHLGLADVPIDRLRGRTKRTFNALLRMCAPHLESLTWVQRRGYKDMAQSFSGDAVQRSKFPALRNLQVSGLRFADDSIFESLISPSGRLRCLGVQRSYVGDYLSKCGTLISLESLTWLPQPEETDDQLISFLQNNSHLKELYLRKAYTTSLLDTKLLPLLSSCFDSLTSLFLIGKENVLEESSLELIGNIRSLELLHLSAGDQIYSFQWVVDHEAIRRNLSNLANLKTLFLSRDVRTIQSPPSSDHDDESSTASDGDTSSMDFGDNPNTDLAAIIAAVTHGANIDPGDGVEEEQHIEEEQGENEEEIGEQDDQSIGSDAEDDDTVWDLTATSRQPFSVPGSGFERSSLSRLLRRMRDEKVEQEVQKYFTAFGKLKMLYIGRQIFDRGYDELTGLLWRNKRWADPEDLLPSLSGSGSISRDYGFDSY